MRVWRQETLQGPGSDVWFCPFLFSGVPCTENDYKLWSPSDERGNECLLGHKTVFKRRTPHATCFNGEDFDRPVVVSNCSCTREDYEWFVPPPWPRPPVASHLLRDGEHALSPRKGISIHRVCFLSQERFPLVLCSNSTAMQFSSEAAVSAGTPSSGFISRRTLKGSTLNAPLEGACFP